MNWCIAPTGRIVLLRSFSPYWHVFFPGVYFSIIFNKVTSHFYRITIFSNPPISPMDPIGMEEARIRVIQLTCKILLTNLTQISRFDFWYAQKFYVKKIASTIDWAHLRTCCVASSILWISFWREPRAVICWPKWCRNRWKIVRLKLLPTLFYRQICLSSLWPTESTSYLTNNISHITPSGLQPKKNFMGRENKKKFINEKQ